MALADPLRLEPAFPDAVPIEEGLERLADHERSELELRGVLGRVDDVGRAHGGGIVTVNQGRDGCV